jgi:hypothetical protein
MAPKQLSDALLAAYALVLVLAVPLLAGDPDMLQDFCVADYKSLDGRKCDLLCLVCILSSQCLHVYINICSDERS